MFLITTMLQIGTSLTLSQIIEPMHNARLVAVSLGVSYILVPLTAIVIAMIIPLEEPLRIGLILLSMTAGSEAGPGFIGTARGDVAFSAALLSMQLAATIIYVPSVLSLLLPEIRIDHSALVLKLLALVLLPMGTGLFLRAKYKSAAEWLSPFVNNISRLFLCLTAVLIIVLHFSEMMRLIGSGAILAGVLFIIFSFGAGYLLGGPTQDTRLTLGFMSGARNAGIALMVASQVFGDPDVLLMITLTVILMLVILAPAAYWFGRRGVS